MQVLRYCMVLVVVASTFATIINIDNNHKLSKLLNGDKLLAGAAKVDASFPPGAPLAGLNFGPRRVSTWPIPKFTKYTTFMNPNEGYMYPTFVKCTVLQSPNAKEQIALVAFDVIGSDRALVELAYKMAVSRGLDAQSLPIENLITGASHTHSGPGAVTSRLIWELAPATDISKQELIDLLAGSIASCVVQAQKSLEPALLGIDYSEVYNITMNRRANISPYVKEDSIDPQLSVIRIDSAQNGKSLATIWNYAIHGTCYFDHNMLISSDIMGVANILIEEKIGGVAMFFNSDAGDINPNSYGCSNKPNMTGSVKLSNAVVATHAKIKPSANVSLAISFVEADFGLTNLNLTLERVGNCSHGGPLEICTICHYLNCDLNLHLGSHWVENNARFNAIRLNVANTDHMIITIPGEALSQLGKEIRLDAKKLGFNHTSIYGYSNSHLAYFTTSNEYQVGGYESLLSFWGISTGERVRAFALDTMKKVVRN